MRTSTVQKVFDRIVRMLGRDAKDDINDNMRDAIMDHFNDRVSTIAQLWNWPEWDVTEERAFTQVWNNNHQYKRVSDLDGRPDEVFYIGNTTYYRVDDSKGADPTVGINPSIVGSQPGGWTVISPIDTFISYDQICRRSIGMALGVYSQNPRSPTGSACGGLKFQPSERGIDVLNPGKPTVFLLYKMPIPEYTMTPYVAGKTYSRGDVVFDPTVGECFQALLSTATIPADSTAWRRQPFLSAWEDYVVWGSFADCLMEYDQGDMSDLQAKMVLSQNANQNADDMFQQEVDILASQGQILHYKPFPRYGCQLNSCWRTSQDWSGGTVSTLTEDCESDLGWVYPSPPQTPQVTWEFHPEVVSVDGLSLALVELSTVNRMAGSLVQIVIGSSGNRGEQLWQILPGPYDPNDGGSKAPNDYDPNTNNKHWEKVGGP